MESFTTLNHLYLQSAGNRLADSALPNAPVLAYAEPRRRAPGARKFVFVTARSIEGMTNITAIRSPVHLTGIETVLLYRYSYSTESASTKESSWNRSPTSTIST